MRNTDNGLVLSASDLTNHLGCLHLTELDRAAAEKRISKPDWRDPALALLQERGFRHEEDYVTHLRSTGKKVIDLRSEKDVPPEEREAHRLKALEATRKAMQSGADYIVQAHLRSGRWMGIADVLRRVDGPSTLGDWHYEPIDTKLSQETRGATILQLCLYADLLKDIQGVVPEQFLVVTPGTGFEPEIFRFEDYSAYYRLVKQRLERTVAGAPRTDTYPDPVEKCDTCRWWQVCDKRRRDDDHLSLVAGISRLQTAELNRQGRDTLETFARQEQPLDERPERGSRESYDRVHRQAQTQLKGREKGELIHELLDPEAGRGLALLPTPDPGDVFFDIESDNFVEGGGLEYLFGCLFQDSGEWKYQAFWALDRAEEKAAFEELMDFFDARWQAFPDFHIYHFSPYDKAAVGRLMGRHGTREVFVDRLFRGSRFVDLMAVTKQGVRASIEGYGLKELEPLIGFERKTDLRDARTALRALAWDLELGRPELIADADKDTVEAYNLEDCVATEALRTWLEERRAELVQKAGPMVRPVHTDGINPEVEDKADEVQEIFDALVDGLPESREDWTDAHEARWLLAHMLEYHRRENKVAYWELFRLTELDREGLEADRKGITGLAYQKRLDTKYGCAYDEYLYPEQEVSLSSEDDLYIDKDVKLGEVFEIDFAKRRIVIKKTRNTNDEHPEDIFSWKSFSPGTLRTSLLSFAKSVIEHGVDGDGPYRAARDLLLRQPPRLVDGGAPLRLPSETAVQAAQRVARDLDQGVLPIQGPPGSGKTYTGARVIVDLVRRGHRVGVTAVSHKVVENLLREVLKASKGTVEVAHKRDKTKGLPDGYKTIGNNHAVSSLDDGKVVGGTGWLCSRDDLEEQLDYLFVDEAGQMALANTIAAGRAAKNIVLLGDPQQLEQPQRGSHPEGAEVATLVHVLGGEETIPPDLGLFLDETWRLHPEVCAFTSAEYYEDRLVPRPDLANQRLSGSTRFAGAGLFHVSVEHTGNQSRSVEEVREICSIVDELLAGGVTWTNRHGETRPLRLKDILVVAPYNSQVGALLTHLPEGACVGTVDKFQGQEAPVVIYSMTSSSSADAPRGMGFLYSPNRLNVATSRARGVCVIVSSPRVLEPECRTPEQMRFANGVCRFGELAAAMDSVSRSSASA